MTVSAVRAAFAAAFFSGCLTAGAPPSRQYLFEENRGQADSAVRFLAHGRGYSLSLRPDGAILDRTASGAKPVRMRLRGANPKPVIEGVDRAGSVSNYLTGNDPAKWRRDVPHFTKVRYRDVYPSIDLVYYGSEGELEYDFIVRPGGDPQRVAFAFEGASARIAASGELSIPTAGGEIRQRVPKVYQADGREISAKYRRLSGGGIGFELAKYDTRQVLTIDPVLLYATYIGGESIDLVYGVAVDGAGNAYVTGTTASKQFPTTSTSLKPFPPGGGDAFLTKYDTAGKIVYSTFIGGAGLEFGYGVAVDGQGSAVVVGLTESRDFPTVNPKQEVNRGGVDGDDGFIIKLNPAGNGIVFSTYWGGNDDDTASGVAIDLANNIYVTGSTYAQNFTVGDNAFQKKNTGGSSAFVSKFTPAGALVYSTLYGGARDTTGAAIGVDRDGNAIVTGNTSSADLPLANPFQPTFKGGTKTRNDAYIAKFNAAGTALIYATYLGGGQDDGAADIAVDSAGNAYVTGRTQSADFPVTAGVLQKALAGPEDAFVSKFSPTGALLFSTYLGAGTTDVGYSVAVDKDFNVYVTGRTDSPNFPLVSPSQEKYGGGDDDVFAVKLNPAATTILGSTYYGGSGAETTGKIAVDAQGTLHIAGDTSPGQLPITDTGAQKSAGGGLTEGYYIRLAFAPEFSPLTLSAVRLNFSGNAGEILTKQSFSIVAAPGGKPNWTVDAVTASGGNWLAVTPKSGSGTATVDVTAATTGLVAGTYGGTITITNAALNTKSTLAVALTIGGVQGTIPSAGIVNGASFGGGGVAAGEIVTIFGSNIGPVALTGLQLDSTGNVASLIAETSVLFDGVASPLIYVSAGQIAAIVPYEVAGKKTTQAQVQYKGVKSNAVTLNVVESSPALFTANSSGKGPAAALNQDGSSNSAANPAPIGSVIVLFGTGEGQTNPAGVNGRPARDVFPKPVLPITVRIGGKDAEVLYQGAAPGLVAGVLQLNVKIPDGVTPGAAAIVLTSGSQSSPVDVTVAVSEGPGGSN